MKRIRVAHIITRMCQGGAQENTFHTCRLLNRDRYDVELIGGPVPPGEVSMEETVRAGGVDILHVDTLRRAPNPWNDVRAYRALTALLRRGRYDIVHTHTSKAGILGRYAARKAGVPIVVHTPHGHIFTGYFSNATTRFFVGMEQRAVKFTDVMIALTERGIADHLERNIGDREQWTAIFSGIDLAPYDAARAQRDVMRRRLGFGPDDIAVGAVGRLEPVKGFSYVVDAARRLIPEHPHLRFVLAGDGSERAALAAQCADLGSGFRMLGHREDIPDLMAAFDVFVLPSLNEGMGRVLLEAGAAGVPCVATAVGGVPEIVVDGRTGIIVPPRDVDALANAIAALAADGDRRTHMGAAAREWVVPQFGLDRMVERIEAVYETILKEKRLDA